MRRPANGLHLRLARAGSTWRASPGAARWLGRVALWRQQSESYRTGPVLAAAWAWTFMRLIDSPASSPIPFARGRNICAKSLVCIHECGDRRASGCGSPGTWTP